MNILFIMYDQLRADYLSCAGHPTIRTPNMDRLAARGVRFSRAYCQSPVCGASRMSFYTGRYVSSHGASWNGYPLKVGEMTLGDHLRPLGMGTWLVGKTHMEADLPGMERLGIARDGIIGARLAECGFDVWARDDGLWAEGPAGFYDQRRSPYNEYLKSKGYASENPWHDNANAADVDGEIASGFLMQNAVYPAHIREEDSETPWLTSEAMKFIEAQGDAPWLCHLSYIKPHWPYIVPAPYHDMYGTDDIVPAVKSDCERQDPHPVYKAFMQGQIGRGFSREEVRQAVIPAYMGLIAQCDDQLGRLLDWLEETGRDKDTVLVLTSDHGDYLGDHWLGEKDLFHDASARIPMIVVDPRAEADATRGTVCDAPVEAIDLAPSFVEWAGGAPAGHILEGHSLLPCLRGESPERRDYVVSEYDYSGHGAGVAMGLPPKDCRLFMVATKEWKLMHAEGGFRPMLFDLVNDPDELVDLGDSPDHAQEIEAMYDRLFEWARRMSQRTAISDTQILARRGGAMRRGILLGLYGDEGTPDELLSKYRGPAGPLPG
ncbi:sulfatase-like hydrolase/transferase [Chachezhania sediminis]|uniref:sulfatase-like hydrolase/transferase n=1 Tax=Chachezhania sediminis TaxID=2599291 RepID=UPI00131D47FB|nr:sulfatase-like hydrolase/transferase [Chachezhania sediminis]